MNKQMRKIGLVHLVIALFCALFGIVYEQFSHGVYSNFMIFAFLIPLAGGALPFILMWLCHFSKLPGRITRNLYNSGIATFTVGSVMQGVMDIYGTSNDLLQVYWYAGAGLVISGLIIYMFEMSKKRRTTE